MVKICDRTWKREGTPKPGPVQVTIHGIDIDEIYDLCPEECETLRSFLNSPNEWRRDSPQATKKVLRLKAKTLQ